MRRSYFSLEDQKKILSQNQIYLTVKQSCSINNGIEQLSEAQKNQYIKAFEAHKDHYSLESFIPASGAASRMFADLTPENSAAFEMLFQNAHKFPFPISESPLPLVQELSQLPKALIPFHKNQTKITTPFEEHLIDNMLFQGAKGNIHFTVSEQHLTAFKTLYNTLKNTYPLQVCFSSQNPESDTICVDLNNQMVQEHSNPLKRPGGHGALLENLNHLNSDIIFIHNIDNVQNTAYKHKAIETKKIIGGMLMTLKTAVDQLLNTLEHPSFKKEDWISVFKLLHIPFEHLSTKELYSILNRPLRVCGMVPNQGEIGGGPFWVEDATGFVHKQIVEKVHIDETNPTQKEILHTSTHFNPVNMACSIKDHSGNVFNLQHFVDPGSCIISTKNLDGKKIKILEYPGLWNGSMAYWNTVFIEIPAETFTPVKTVFDLLKPEHQ